MIDKRDTISAKATPDLAAYRIELFRGERRILLLDDRPKTARAACALASIVMQSASAAARDEQVRSGSADMLATLRMVETALAAIVSRAPKEEPETPEYADGEELESHGIDVGAWEAAEHARPALENVRAAIARAEGRS